MCRMLSACNIGFVVIGLICSQTLSTLAQEVPSAGAPAPDWKLTGLDGKTVKFSDFRGKVVILNFWATWCMPCRIEIPDLAELQKQYGDKGLAIVGVSLDEQGPEVVKKFMKQFQMTYLVVIGNEKIVAAYGGIEGIPTTFVIGRDGRIVSRHIGFAEKEVLEREIRSLL
jgi:thiol-disulfide isomerase/thioredoxin